MKPKIRNAGSMIGAVAGLFLFMIAGLLPSSFVGGVLGLSIAGALFGDGAGTALLSRTVVGLSMVAGVLVTGIVFIGGLSCIGWMIGKVSQTARLRRARIA